MVPGVLKAQSGTSFLEFVPSQRVFFQNDNSVISEYPDPKKVLHQSLIVPGWGQVTNKQIWKVPIVYGLLGGLTYYSVYLNVKYHDYRAAYYNSFPENTDYRFGKTPSYISPTANPALLKENRDNLRNRRDMVYVGIGLAYALNAIDAYVFAHLRTFDVSDDLSMNLNVNPGMISSGYKDYIPTVSVSISLSK